MDATSFGPENLTGGTTNYTTMQPIGLGFGISLICIFIATFIVGFIGNGLVIFLTSCRMKTTVNSIWFLNLAIADFIFILSIIILPFIGFSSLMFVFSMTITLNQFASIFFLVVISLDRCLCTWMVVWAQNNRTVLRARIICMIVWVLSIGYCIPFLTVNVFPNTFLVAYVFLVGFLIPFLIIASSHIAVGVRIRRLKMGKQHSCLNPILYVFMCDEYKKKLKQSLLLVLETAFSEEHLIFRGRQIQKDEQNKKNTFELLDM